MTEISISEKLCEFRSEQENFMGESFGVEGEVIGEIVFNTGMTGYQEVLTDPWSVYS